ncbi:MAG: Rrf2 family transcriptional regulator [Spirochaetes bacterium]|nr:Rrf2 family transcriptional regulator [Spirochaetota bacterium]
MRITANGRYALRATLALAKMAKDGKAVSISTLAQAENISAAFLEKIFFKLKKAGIVKSERGPGGGFSFTRPADSLSLYEIMEAAGEEMTVLPCDRSVCECGRQGQCEAHKVIVSVTDTINSYLQGITLKMVLDGKEFQQTHHSA